MEEIHLRYTCGKKTLASGRQVEVGLSEDHTYWCFRFGDLDNPEDSVRFAISDEAFQAMEEIIDQLRTSPQPLGWPPIMGVLRAMVREAREPT